MWFVYLKNIFVYSKRVNIDVKSIEVYLFRMYFNSFYMICYLN
jgi:hypothetical protein